MALARLEIDIVAKLASLEQSLGGATRVVERNMAAMRAQIDAASKSLAGLAGAVGVGALSAMARNVLNGVDALNDFADATGTSVENASALEDAAARTGTAFESAQSALVKFNAVLSDSAKKDSEAARIFQRLGLNAQELRSIDPADALLKTSQALQGIASDGDRARIVQELFGKSVREVAPFLKDLAEQGQLVATVTSEQAAAAEQFNKAISGLQKDALDLGRAALLPLAEAFNAVRDAINGAQVNFDKLGDGAKLVAVPLQALTVLGANVAFVLRGVGDEIGGIAAQAVALSTQGLKGAQAVRAAMLENAAARRKELDDFERRVLGLGGAVGGKSARDVLRGIEGAAGDKRGVGSLGDRPGKNTAIEDALKRIADTDEKKIARIRAELQALIALRKSGASVPDAAFASLAEDLAKLDPAARAAAESMKAFEEARAKAGEMARKADDASSKAADALAEANEALRQEIELIGKSADERARLEQARIGNIIASKEEELVTLRNAEASAAQIASLEREIELLRQRRSLVGQRAVAEKSNENNLEALRGQTDGVKDAAKDLGMTFASAAEEAIVKWQGFSSLMKGIEQDLLRIGARKLITEPLANAATGFLSSLMGGGAGTSGKDASGINAEGGAGFWASVIQLFAGGFAKGGYIPPGQWGIVGERGPEVAYGGRNGKTITPIGGGSTFVYNAAPGGSRQSTQQQAEDFFRLGASAASRNR